MDKLLPHIAKNRKTAYDIAPLILNRYSPRALSPEKLTESDILPLFEAARWAPSSYNAQPWRFMYAFRGTTHWQSFFDLLVEGNKSWATNAAVLVVVASRRNFEHNETPSITHLFDAGAAWENLALEASKRGLVAHGMEGFDYAKAKQILKIPEGYDVCCMIAIGKHGRTEDLPEGYREGETPNGRKDLKEIVTAGVFAWKK